MARDVSFLTFFLVWARLQGWAVPLLHVRICEWLEHCRAPERVLMVFRGAAKSTIYAVYKAWRLYRNRDHRSLVWSADNDTAGMLTADTINVLRNHPLTRGMLPPKPGAKRFWVTGARDARNASMRAVGVSSNATGARADDVDFDDVEVPGNIESPEARLKLRQRISESTHIAVPGAQKSFIGTPHTSDSIYPERIAAGAAALKIPLFEHVARFTETERATRYRFPFAVAADGLYVMTGIHRYARMLEEGRDYLVVGQEVVFAAPPRTVLDVCTGCAWPERFHRAEIALRRRETLTLNAWDSQYQLEAKPIAEIRLDPERLVEYTAELVLERANRALRLMLGSAQVVSSRAYWDPSKGKVGNDASALSLVLDDLAGNQYWHVAEAVTGELVEFADSSNTRIVGGQVLEIARLAKRFHIPSIYVETNGLGAFIRPVLLRALRQEGIVCGVVEKQVSGPKNPRILAAVEPPLSGGILWAHSRVLDGPAWDQMKDWNPGTKDQADDHLDALAGALTQAPVRIARKDGIPTDTLADDWRPRTGTPEVVYER